MKRTVWLSSILLGAGNAGAQPAAPLDQGYADVSPLQTSLRIQNYDLRAPAEFNQVYRVPGSDTLLSRSDGALTAVFEQSSYVATRGGGVSPIVPPGTLYVIGPLPQELGASPPDVAVDVGLGSGAGPFRIDLAVPATDVVSRVLVTTNSSAQWGPPEPTEPERPTIWDDPGYRQHRIEILLRRAVELES